MWSATFGTSMKTLRDTRADKDGKLFLFLGDAERNVNWLDWRREGRMWFQSLLWYDFPPPTRTDVYSPQIAKWQQSKDVAPPKSSLVNDWVHCCYLQEHRAIPGRCTMDKPTQLYHGNPFTTCKHLVWLVFFPWQLFTAFTGEGTRECSRFPDFPGALKVLFTSWVSRICLLPLAGNVSIQRKLLHNTSPRLGSAFRPKG